MKQLFFLAMVLGGCLMWTTPAWAIDRDDDVRADDDEHIAYEASSSQESAKTEAKFPDEALAIRQAIERHVDHANTRNIDGHMAETPKSNANTPQKPWHSKTSTSPSMPSNSQPSRVPPPPSTRAKSPPTPSTTGKNTSTTPSSVIDGSKTPTTDNGKSRLQNDDD